MGGVVATVLWPNFVSAQSTSPKTTPAQGYLVIELQFSPDGRLLASVGCESNLQDQGQSASLRLYDCQSWQQLSLRHFEEALSYFHWLDGDSYAGCQIGDKRSSLVFAQIGRQQTRKVEVSLPPPTKLIWLEQAVLWGCQSGIYSVSRASSRSPVELVRGDCQLLAGDAQGILYNSFDKDRPQGHFVKLTASKSASICARLEWAYSVPQGWLVKPADSAGLWLCEKNMQSPVLLATGVPDVRATFSDSSGLTLLGGQQLMHLDGRGQWSSRSLQLPSEASEAVAYYPASATLVFSRWNGLSRELVWQSLNP